MPGIKYNIVPTADRNDPPLLDYGNNWQKDASRTEKGDFGVNFQKIDKGEMQNCLDKLRYSHWRSIKDMVPCGNLHWELTGQNSWRDPRTCHLACVNSLSRAINSGANSAWCNMKHKGQYCREGYTWMTYVNARIGKGFGQ